MFRSDKELVDEGMYVASSTRAAGTSGTSDSDTTRVSRALLGRAGRVSSTLQREVA